MSGKNRIKYTALILIIILVILFIYIVIENINNQYIIVPTIIGLTILCLYYFVKELKKQNKQISISKKILKNSFKDNLDSITTPVSFVNMDGQILWKNKLCDNKITDEEILNAFAKYINSKKEYIDLSKFKFKFTNALDKTFIANYEIVTIENIENLVITFIDITDEEKIRTSVKKNNSNVAVVVVDNYDDTFQGLEEIEKVEIVNKIDAKLRIFVSDNNGIIEKTDKDKYLIIIKQQYIDKFIENKFEILEEIKQISDKTKLPITISIGISAIEEEISDKYRSAAQALEIAQGRGGNQVVIKRNKKFDFYGDLNEEQDRTSRVKARSVADGFVELLNRSNNVYIVGHKNPDADCIGSSIGISKICNIYKKKHKNCN